jgi:hypothetical protein
MSVAAALGQTMVVSSMLAVKKCWRTAEETCLFDLESGCASAAAVNVQVTWVLQRTAATSPHMRLVLT